VVTQPEDKSILHEIVRVVEARGRVPDKVQVQTREYLITYLADHRNRLEEALRRYDTDRLNMLFGQLASKIKYQFNRIVPARPVEPPKPAKKEAPKKTPAKKSVAKAPAAKRAAAKKVAKKRPAAAAKKKTAAKKTAAKKAAAKKKPAAKKHK
jgi:hypothetical protein